MMAKTPAPKSPLGGENLPLGSIGVPVPGCELKVNLTGVACYVMFNGVS